MLNLKESMSNLKQVHYAISIKLFPQANSIYLATWQEIYYMQKSIDMKQISWHDYNASMYSLSMKWVIFQLVHK
jgi:hypothetical protein